jgi:hypothetical protein
MPKHAMPTSVEPALSRASERKIGKSTIPSTHGIPASKPETSAETGLFLNLRQKLVQAR